MSYFNFNAVFQFLFCTLNFHKYYYLKACLFFYFFHLTLFHMCLNLILKWLSHQVCFSVCSSVCSSICSSTHSSTHSSIFQISFSYVFYLVQYFSSFNSMIYRISMKFIKWQTIVTLIMSASTILQHKNSCKKLWIDFSMSDEALSNFC